MISNLACRSVLAFATVLGLTVAARPASAQIDAGVIDGGDGDVAVTPPALSTDDLALSLLRYDVGQAGWVKLAPTEQAYFFNRARCECAADTAAFAGSFKIAIEASPTGADKIRSLLRASAMGSGRAALYAGTNAVNCLVPSAMAGPAPAYCLNLLDPSNHGASVAGGLAAIVAVRRWESPPIPVAWLFNAARLPLCNSPASCAQTSPCGDTRSPLNLYFWVETSTAGVPDRTDLALSLDLAGTGFMAPSNVTVRPSDGALGVEWSWGSLSPSATGSFLGVQLFCQRGAGDEVFAPGTFTSAFSSAAVTCPEVAPVPPTPLPFANLSPGFLCSDLLPATATRHRIAGLQNGVSYGVAVAAVDKYGNVSASDLVFQFPNGTDADAGAADGGAATKGSGGGCSLVGGAGRDGWAGFALLTLAAALIARTRSRCRGRARSPYSAGG